ncbi:MAG: tRNA uridine-5-carboxymethylaminomethyl(34) synthesis GTPase MnmE [Bacteroidales bacterium]|nr:tRNA uridine-5-carboxymethylaminomethyl(34) synthesis GTPase MnmE [Bacteroidales bacterium]
MYQTDDICAIATGGVQSAIAIIRISGSNIIDKLSKIIVFKNSEININKCKTSQLYRIEIHYDQKLLDDGLLALFRSPKSYTGEDLVELYLHGSLYIQQEILKVLQNNGIRLAQPGEFSLRAYLNGKMDLTQAEAVHDIITSSNSLSHTIAMQQMRGGIGNEIRLIKEKLLQLLSLVELELDFSEEDVEFASRDKILNLLNNFIERIHKLSLSFDYGNAIKKGVLIAIVGETNVGKSTLMNALLNDERSIVSSIPGTTRDVIEDSFTYKGVTFRFIDTAGIRKTTDEIEQIGVELAIKKASEAKLLLLLVNANDKWDVIKSSIDYWKNQLHQGQQLLVVLNKIDKVSASELGELTLKINQLIPKVFAISAKFKLHIELLMDEMYDFVQSLHVTGSENIITNARQYNALILALQAAQNAKEAIINNIATDLLAEELKMVNMHLSQVIGEIPSQEVLNEIFSRFCIGK